MKLNWNIMKQTLDLDEVESTLGINVISSSDGEDVARCPLPTHGGVDSNPSFAINRDKLVYNCFTCGTGGSLPQLVMELEGLEWEEALAWLRKFTDESVRDDPTLFAQVVKRILYMDEEQSDSSMPWFNESVLDPWLDGPFDYFTGRGISEDVCRSLKLGFDSNYTRYDRKKKTEWTGQAAIIPHFFEGNLVGYQARVMDTEDNPKPLGMPKYDNTSGFPKADTLYNWDVARTTSNIIYVFESALTVGYAMSLGQMAVGTFGAQLADEQIRLLRTFPRIVLGFDDDVPGRQATERVIEANKKFQQVFVMPPVGVEKGDLLDLNVQDATEHMGIYYPASLHSYYTE